MQPNAYRVYLIFVALSDLGFTLAFTVNMLFQVQVVGLTPLQLVLVGTVLETTVFLFEIPTGVVADVYSRRLSIITGSLLLGVGLVISVVPIFEVILLSQVIMGIGYTFHSGASAAWITDEIGETQAGQAFFMASQVGRGMALAGIILSVITGSINLQLAIIAGGVLHLLVVIFLLLFMKETGFTPAPREDRETWRSMTRTFKDGVQMTRRRPVLLTIFAITVILGAASESFDRLWTPHLLENFPLPYFEPVVWFGIIDVVTLLTGIVVTEVIRRRIKTDSHRAVARALLVMQSIYITGTLIFALSGALWLALAAYWTMRAMRGLGYPLQTAWINQGLDPKVRATVLSMSGQMDAFGQIFGGPGLGYMGNVFGVRAALAAGGLLITPALWLYARTLRRGDATQAA